MRAYELLLDRFLQTKKCMIYLNGHWAIPDNSGPPYRGQTSIYIMSLKFQTHIQKKYRIPVVALVVPIDDRLFFAKKV